MRTVIATIVLASTLGFGVATAQPSISTTSTAATADDPNGDRGLYGATALMQPVGTVTVSNHMALLVGATVGLHERFQISAHAAPVGLVSEETKSFGHVLGKLGIKTRGRVRVAAFAGVGAIDRRIGSVWLPQAGVAVTRCLDADCGSSLSGTMTAARPIVKGTEESGSFVLAGAGANYVRRLSPWLKLVVEGNMVADPDEGDVGGFASIGLRLHSRRWALEAHGIAAVDNDSGMGPLPWLSGAYRFE